MGRKLADLYIVGRDVEVDDGTGDPVVVWLQKLNPVEHDKAMRKAQSARAKVLAARHQQQSETYEIIAADVALYERETMISLLAQDELSNVSQAVEARVAEEKGWNKEDYLQGLREAWNGDEDTEGLSFAHARGEDDDNYDESVRILEELKRFAAELDHELELMLADATHRYDEVSDEKLRELTVDKLLKIQADMAWLQEFRRCQLWLACREPQNHKVYYFGSREELDPLQDEVTDQLLNAYALLEVDVIEGKGSEEAEPSSASSESPKAPSKPSGRKAATASKTSQ